VWHDLAACRGKSSSRRPDPLHQLRIIQLNGGLERIVTAIYIIDKHTRYADRFIRHQTIQRYRRLLATATDEVRRGYLRGLVAAEQQKQVDAEDPKYLF
jgi:hypothetical protein